MRALIISDSHGLEKELKEVIDRHRDEVDIMIHCGDSELASDHPVLQGVQTVEGNCDDQDEFPMEWIKILDDCVFYVTHGHEYNVKQTYVPVSYRAEEIGAHIVCFGHSHVAVTFEVNGVIFINPGSLRLPRDTNKQTYCICERTPSETIVTFYEQSGKKNEKRTQRFITKR